MRDTKKPRRYLTVDLWDTEAKREQALIEHETEYADLEAAFSDWVESKTEVGVFRVLAEGTVRPHSRTQRSKTGESRRRNR